MGENWSGGDIRETCAPDHIICRLCVLLRGVKCGDVRVRQGSDTSVLAACPGLMLLPIES